MQKQIAAMLYTKVFIYSDNVKYNETTLGKALSSTLSPNVSNVTAKITKCQF
jgi:hypothetical protein